MARHPKSHPLDPIHQEADDADRQVIELLARRFDAVQRVGSILPEEDAPGLDTGRQHGARAFWIQDAEALHQSVPFDRRMLKEILNQSRRLQGSQRPLSEADQADRPSVTEVLTIEQYGYPRTYNLNDGMGPDIAC
jgi:chorismate mutase